MALKGNPRPGFLCTGNPGSGVVSRSGLPSCVSNDKADLYPERHIQPSVQTISMYAVVLYVCSHLVSAQLMIFVQFSLASAFAGSPQPASEYVACLR